MGLTAHQIARRHMSPRCLRLDLLDRFVEGTQYDNRVPFYAAGSVPLLERAPNIVYPIVGNAIRSDADMVLGEWRWPTITSASPEDESDSVGDDDATGDASSLSESESQLLDALIVRIVEQARLKSTMREALEKSLGVGTSVPVLAVKNGRLSIETVEAAWCSPKLDPATGEVLSLEILYPYILDSFDAACDKWVETCWLYRRAIDAQFDVVYLPVPAPKNPTDPVSWIVETSVQHDLGFCPVVWYPRDVATHKAGEIDGRAIHRGVLDEIEAHDFAVSQRNRAALYMGDPQQYQTGVEPRETGPTGRAANGQPADQGWRDSKGQQLGGGSSAVRRRGPGVVLTSENPDAKFGVLALPGDALKAQDENARDLKEKIQESLAVVEIDLANAGIAKDASGKALEILYLRQVNACNRIREDFGDRCLLRVVCMLLRLALVVARRSPGGLYLRKLAASLPLLARFERKDSAGTVMWVPPDLDLVWGPYFRNQAVDQASVLTTVTVALKEKLITRRMALEKLKSEGIFEIGSPEALLEAIAAEDATAMEPTQDVAAPNPNTATTNSTLVLTPSDLATIVRVDEGRAGNGLGPFGGSDGGLTIAAFKAKHSAIVASSAAADLGKTQAVDPFVEADQGAKPAFGAPHPELKVDDAA